MAIKLEFFFLIKSIYKDITNQAELMIQMLEKKLTGAILGIKTGTKTKADAEGFLAQLDKINPMLAEDFKKKIDAAVLAAKK